MKILAVDTSAKTSSVSVVDESGTVSLFTINTALTHSQTLMPMIESAISAAGLSLNDIDGFGCASGPGSFTGLRIGIGAIKGLSYGTGKPCVGVSTLKALCMNMEGLDGIICAVMDARCNQVYTAVFEHCENEMKRLCEDMAVSIDELCEYLLSFKGKKIFFVGDGANLCYNKLYSVLGNAEVTVTVANDILKRQNAASVGSLALPIIQAGKGISPTELMPVYLRLPQAERELNLKNRKD